MLLKQYENAVNHLTRYAPVHLFDSDTPSAKEKKLEARCIHLCNLYYNYTNFTLVRETLREIVIDEQLGCNETILDVIFADYGRLQAYVEQLEKDCKAKLKQEKCLIDFYQVQIPKLEYAPLYEYVLTMMSDNDCKIACCHVAYKKQYFDSYKQTKQFIKENWK